MNKSGSYPLFDTTNSPADVRKLKKDQLKPLAKELRESLTHTESISGGHFSAGLGTVELAVALHYVFDTPSDQLIHDVAIQNLDVLFVLDRAGLVRPESPTPCRQFRLQLH